MFSRVKAITFDDFYTLRYPVGEKEDIVYLILKSLKRKLDLRDDEFLNEYFRADAAYRERLRETQRESLLDDIVLDALQSCGYRPANVGEIVRTAINEGQATKRTSWFPDAKWTLLTLKERGYRLGLVSDTHWRISEKLREEFGEFFKVVTLSYEHGYAKPHPSIFLITLRKMGATPSHSLHVGDDPTADVQGARNVGMKTVFVKRGGMIADADAQIERLSELTTFLPKLD